jgi:hypothetical protein
LHGDDRSGYRLVVADEGLGDVFTIGVADGLDQLVLGLG